MKISARNPIHIWHAVFRRWLTALVGAVWLTSMGTASAQVDPYNCLPELKRDVASLKDKLGSAKANNYVQNFEEADYQKLLADVAQLQRSLDALGGAKYDFCGAMRSISLNPSTARYDRMVRETQPPPPVVPPTPTISYGTHICAKPTTTRPAGTAPKGCADANLEVDEALCYKKCPAGSNGTGVFCYQNCPEGFASTVHHCTKPATSYGVGKPFTKQEQCEAESGGAGSCQKLGALYYKDCKAGFKTIGLTCSPTCPAGFKDIGAGCERPKIERGAGVPQDLCPSGKSFQTGLCYEPCRDRFKGVAASCNFDCAAIGRHACGAYCTTDKSYCDQMGILIPAIYNWVQQGGKYPSCY